MTRIAVGMFCLVTGASVQAASPWDGSWYVDRSSSQVAPTRFSIVNAHDGTWKFDSGEDLFVFSQVETACVHAAFRADTTFAGIVLTATTFDYVESTYGKETVRRHMTASPGGQTLSIHETGTTADGVQTSSDSTAVRVGEGLGLEGTWRTGEDEARGKVSASPAPRAQPSLAAPAGPTVVVFTSADGLTSWYFPFSGEVIRGRADGRRRAITGSLMPSNLTTSPSP